MHAAKFIRTAMTGPCALPEVRCAVRAVGVMRTVSAGVEANWAVVANAWCRAAGAESR